MKAQTETITPVKKKLTVEIEAAEIQNEVTASLNQLRRTVSISGFRKGKAPMDAVRRLYGDQVRADAISTMIQKSYSQAVRDEDLFPVNDADIEIQDAPEDGSITYSAVIEVRPEVTPQGYKDLDLKKEELRVDETEVEARLETIRQQQAAFEEAPDGYEIADGDMAIIDFEGFIDGEAFEGGKAEGHPLMVGAGRMIPGFEEGVIGAKTGEELTVEVTFPEKYQATELAGKDAQFQVKVGMVKQRVLPTLDDTFAKEVMKLESLDELREKVRDAIKAEQERRVEGEFRQKLISLLLEANPFEVPESLVTGQQQHTVERMRADFQGRGMDPDQIGMDKPEFQQEARQAAERSVRWAFLLDAISEAEGVAVTDEDVEARIHKIAEADGRPYTTIRGFFEGEEQMASLKNALREDKGMDAILATAKVEEVSADEWEKWRGAVS